MEREELADWLRLTLAPGVGNGASRKLLAAFGLPWQIFSQPLSALSIVVGPALAAVLPKQPPGLASLLDDTWTWLHKEDTNGQRRILALGDPDYPQSLLNIEDPPLLLYLAGCARSEDKLPLALNHNQQLAHNSIASSFAQSIAIVGSRNPTPQGLENAREFARALGAAGLTVISGLALGIDGAAHEGALQGHPESPGTGSGRLATIAVVGTGLDRVYPKSHHKLAHRICQRGLIISEYPIGTPPLAANFPKRNRIIAGLAQGTLVVEAALKSGSLITARLAAEQGKEVFAIPGSIHSVQARGCHYLIRLGAKLVESAQDVLEDMKLEPVLGPAENSNDDPGLNGPDHEQASLLEAIGFDPVSLDALQARTGMTTARLQAQLMSLELDELVARLHGGLIQRLVKA